jgi:phosphoglycerol transferase
MISAACAALAIGLGVAANVAPNAIHRLQAGPNPEAITREAGESEIHGLKLIQLLLPRPSHRSPYLSEIARSYAASHPLVLENVTASLGAIGACGLLILGICLFRRLSGGPVDERAAFLALITLTLFMLGTIGGFGSVFATAISPIIRAWNRVSIFIAFPSLLAFFLVLQAIVRRVIHRAGVLRAIAAAIGVLGFLDQTAPPCLACNERTRAAFQLDRDFIQKIEQTVPADAAIYQLPYVAFPEVPPLFRLQPYESLAGFVHSKTLKWSAAGMKGRDGDRFFRALAQKTVPEQIEVVKQKGFSGVYVDRRGYEDGAKELLQQLTLVLGPPSLTRSDGAVVFFAFNTATNAGGAK